MKNYYQVTADIAATVQFEIIIPSGCAASAKDDYIMDQISKKLRSALDVPRLVFNKIQKEEIK